MRRTPCSRIRSGAPLTISSARSESGLPPARPARASSAARRTASRASPLYPAERHRLEYSGQRILGRVQVQVPISIWVKWHQDTPIAGEMRNLSLNGMAFNTPVLFEVNQIVRVDCKELRALGRIAHAEQAKSGAHPFTAGLEFLTLRLPQDGGTLYSSNASLARA
jgi:hypothetical protein